ncbi:MAG: histidine phosphatase family protein [Gammaproteobacteria bacterium]|nr:histidine phosphatase family protein [Gammaproteobacteria bacterium]
MGKQLILFRHGKSDWDTQFSADHDRPLAERGIHAARTMGKILNAAQQLPDKAITSSAIRASTTLALAHEAGHWHCPIEITDQLYSTDPESMLELLQKEDDNLKRLLLVGHEPTWSTLISGFTGAGVKFPTAAMARIDFDCAHWHRINWGQGRLNWLLKPKLFTRTSI